MREDNLTLVPANELLGRDEFTKNPTLTKGEIDRLISLTKHTKELEDLFSWRCGSTFSLRVPEFLLTSFFSVHLREKDYRSQSSRLSAVESYCFHRTFHILLLYSSTYGLDAYRDEYFENLGN
jgi:hypothetical protein